MKYICFAASSLHLICIKELLIRDNVSDYKVFFLNFGNKNSIKQFITTSKFLKIKKFETINLYNFRLFEILSRFSFLIKLKIRYRKIVTTFVFMDFRNTFLQMLRFFFKKSKFILIDDGFQTFIVYKKYIINNFFFPYDRFNNFFFKVIIFIFFKKIFNYLILTKYDIFTIYGKVLGLAEKSQNNLVYLKNIISKKKIKYSNKYVYFAGGKLSERGAVSLSEELLLLKKLSIYWQKKGKELIFVSKRSTSYSKLEIIKKKLKIRTISFDLPLELVFFYYKKVTIPIVCSFGSTLNQTLPLLYKNIKIYLIYCKLFEKKNNLREALKLSKIFFLKFNSKKNIIII